MHSRLLRFCSSALLFKRQSYQLHRLHTMSPAASHIASNFSLIKEVKTSINGITVKKWKSNKTQLVVIKIGVSSPITKGFFVLPTEIVDDSGCPHTLEHLVFLGSEKYPYKGILDSLATRAFSEGTNAWTDQDNTTYTLETAGWQGFLNLLPIYVDHILFPTLTDTGYVTEVHHISGKGEDAGVVYSEMQGRQNGTGDLISLATQRMMYPEGCGYRSETGGLMESLRLLNVDKIRKYHGSYYVPQNLCLIISGNVDETKLLETLQQMDEQISQRSGGVGSNWKRPFVDSLPVPPLVSDKKVKIEFPEEDESVGQVMISWHGPKYIQYLDMQAIDIIGEYLSSSSVSILQKELVEIDDPYCTEIDFWEENRTTCALCIMFSGVPKDKIEITAEKFFELLKRLVEKDGIDMKRIEMLIKRDRRRRLENTESNPHATAMDLISEYIYGEEDGSSMVSCLQELERFDELLTWTAEQWTAILRKWYLDNPHGICLGYPSAKLAKTLEQNENKRIDNQRAKIGDEGLKDLQRKLEEAQKSNDIEIPTKIITDFPVPTIDTINWIEVKSGESDPDLTKPRHDTDIQKILNNDPVDLAYFTHFSSVQSSFTRVQVYISLADLPPRLRPYMDIYQTALFGLPVVRATGEKLTYEQVVDVLEDRFVGYSSFIRSRAVETLCLDIESEPELYGEAISWLRDLICGLQFDLKRLKVFASKHLNQLPELKRAGDRVLYAAMEMITYDTTKSTSCSINLFSQSDFLPRFAERLESDPDAVIRDLKEIQSYLCQQKNIRLHIVSDIAKLPLPKTTITDNFIKCDKHERTVSPLFGREIMTNAGLVPNNTGKIVRHPSIESSFSQHVGKGPENILDADTASLAVALQMLTAMEGPFWKHIRGAGLAYGVNMTASYRSGLINMTLYRAPDAYNAYTEARKVVKKIANREMKFEETDLAGAKSSLVCSTVSDQESVAQAASISFSSQVLLGVLYDSDRELLSRTQKVTLDDVYEVIDKYVLDMFEPAKTNNVVVSGPTKFDEIATKFRNDGFNLELLEINDVALESDRSSCYGSDSGESD